MTKPPDRRRDAGHETRERLLAAARARFASRGYADTSIRDLCRDAGCNLAAVGYHFGDKDGLYDAVISRLYEDLRALPAEGIVDSDDPIQALIDRTWALASAHEAAVRILHRHVMDRGELPGESMSRWATPLLERVTGWLAAVKPDASPTELHLVVMTILHLLVRYLIEPEASFRALHATDLPRDVVVPRWIAHVARSLLAAPRFDPPKPAP